MGSVFGSVGIFFSALLLLAWMCGGSISANRDEICYRSFFLLKRKYDARRVSVSIDLSYGAYGLPHMLIFELSGGKVLLSIPTAKFCEDSVGSFIEYLGVAGGGLGRQS